MQICFKTTLSKGRLASSVLMLSRFRQCSRELRGSLRYTACSLNQIEQNSDPQSNHFADAEQCLAMIRTFKCKETEKIFNRQRSGRLPHNIQQRALRKLRMLNNAATLQDLRMPPANRLERLRGDRAGQYGIRINDQWRICFEWLNGDTDNVEIVDYH